MMYYREDKKGQILQEGICEAGAMSSWIAAGNGIQQLRLGDDAVFYLLFHVWFSTHRRFSVGGG